MWISLIRVKNVSSIKKTKKTESFFGDIVCTPQLLWTFPYEIVRYLNIYI